jgi:hypothetical protein
MRKAAPVLLSGLLFLSSCNTQNSNVKVEKEQNTIEEVTKGKQDNIEVYNSWLTTYIENYGKAIMLFNDWAEKPKTGNFSNLEESINILTHTIEEARTIDPPLSEKDGHTILLKGVDSLEEFVKSYPVKGSDEWTNEEAWTNFIQKYNQAQITNREYGQYLEKGNKELKEAYETLQNSVDN